MCQSTGPETDYVWNFKIYTGQDNEPDLPASTKIVLNLMEPLLGQGYNVYLNNWYSSSNLFSRLVKKNKNKCMWNCLLELKKYAKGYWNGKKGQISLRSSNENIIALVLKDKKDVKMLSTMHISIVVNTGKTMPYANHNVSLTTTKVWVA